ncbi:hypothetical protein C7M84_023062 [Penaeus vannamei]|uniref:Uncharacterized protein n=1 Tax=Penaeus vannamei TaxID=6689 RepID=A0A3R7MJY7_PENVA|nr:hypothetical protein C7M84_023062 [Penaeus vannamei]
MIHPLDLSLVCWVFPLLLPSIILASFYHSPSLAIRSSFSFILSRSSSTLPPPLSHLFTLSSVLSLSPPPPPLPCSSPDSMVVAEPSTTSSESVLSSLLSALSLSSPSFPSSLPSPASSSPSPLCLQHRPPQPEKTRSRSPLSLFPVSSPSPSLTSLSSLSLGLCLSLSLLPFPSPLLSSPSRLSLLSSSPSPLSALPLPSPSLSPRVAPPLLPSSSLSRPHLFLLSRLLSLSICLFFSRPLLLLGLLALSFPPPLSLPSCSPRFLSSPLSCRLLSLPIPLVSLFGDFSASPPFSLLSPRIVLVISLRRYLCLSFSVASSCRLDPPFPLVVSPLPRTPLYSRSSSRRLSIRRFSSTLSSLSPFLLRSRLSIPHPSPSPCPLLSPRVHAHLIFSLSLVLSLRSHHSRLSTVSLSAPLLLSGLFSLLLSSHFGPCNRLVSSRLAFSSNTYLSFLFLHPLPHQLVLFVPDGFLGGFSFPPSLLPLFTPLSLFFFLRRARSLIHNPVRVSPLSSPSLPSRSLPPSIFRFSLILP